ncbi:MAG: hypothetical protein HW416_375 [Chloroflexi bacterium]|nr:hypothetical protein [Chloroflexota bacterium]
MDSADRITDDLEIEGAMPERWETAIEDVAQVVALALDRVQDLVDLINDQTRARPGVAKILLAGVGGAVVGAFVAGRLRPRRDPTLTESTAALMRAASNRGSSALEEAASIAKAAAERVSHRIPSRGDIQEQVAHLNGSAIGTRADRKAMPDAGQLRHAAELFPIAIALIRNPIIRDFLARSAMRATRRG